MQNPLVGLTVEQLKRAVEIKQQIESLESELGALLGGAAPTKPASIKRGRPPKSTPPVLTGKTKPKPKWTLGPEARAKLSALAKARWRKARAQGRSHL